MKNKINEYKSFFLTLKEIIPDFVVSGSIATMLYLNKFVRECNDIDIHFDSKEILNKLYRLEIFNYQVDIVSEKSGVIRGNDIDFKLDINYTNLLFQEEGELKLIKLEKLIADKILRASIDADGFPRIKDLYDLQFLLKLKYNKPELIENLRENFNLHHIKDKESIFIEQDYAIERYLTMFNNYLGNTAVFYEFNIENTVGDVINILKMIGY